MKVIDSKDPACKIALELTPQEVVDLAKIGGLTMGPVYGTIRRTISNLFASLYPVVEKYRDVLPKAGSNHNVKLHADEWDFPARM